MDELQCQTSVQAVSPAVSWTSATLLSPREKQLLRRFALGKSDRVIAYEIGGTQQQIAVQRKTLTEKLHIQSQAQLVTLAAQLAAWPARRASGKYLRRDGGKDEPSRHGHALGADQY